MFSDFGGNEKLLILDTFGAEDVSSINSEYMRQNYYSDQIARWAFDSYTIQSGWAEIGNIFLAILFAGSGSGLYGLPAYKYVTGDDGPWLDGFPRDYSASMWQLFLGDAVRSKAFGWYVASSVVIVSIAIYYMTYFIYFDRVKKNKVPPELERLIFSERRKAWYKRRATWIFFLAFMSAIPLATTAVAYSFWDNEAFKIFYSLVMLIDNTVLHLLPVLLLLTDPIFGMPLRLISSGVQVLRDRCDSNLEQTQLERQKASDMAELRARIASFFDKVENKFLQEALSQDTEVFLTSFKDAGCSLETFIAYGGRESNIKSPNRSVHAVLFWVSLILVGYCCNGYMANSLKLLPQALEDWGANKETSIVFGGGGAAFGSFIFSVLMMFLGTSNVSANLTWIANGCPKVLATQLRPKTAWTLKIITFLFSAPFGGAAAVQMVRDYISEDNPFYTFGLFSAWSGLFYLGLGALCDFINSEIERYELFCGSEKNRKILTLREKLREYKAKMLKMSDGFLKNDLNELKNKDLEALTGLTREKYEKLIDHEGNLERKKAAPSCFSRFRATLFARGAEDVSLPHSRAFSEENTDGVVTDGVVIEFVPPGRADDRRIASLGAAR